MKILNTYFINLLVIVVAITPQKITKANGKKYNKIKIKVLTRARAKRLKTFLSW